MTIERDELQDELRALMKFSQQPIPDYASDPAVQRRVGRVLANVTSDINDKALEPRPEQPSRPPV